MKMHDMLRLALVLLWFIAAMTVTVIISIWAWRTL